MVHDHLCSHLSSSHGGRILSGSRLKADNGGLNVLQREHKRCFLKHVQKQVVGISLRGAVRWWLLAHYLIRVGRVNGWRRLRSNRLAGSQRLRREDGFERSGSSTWGDWRQGGKSLGFPLCVRCGLARFWQRFCCGKKSKMPTNLSRAKCWAVFENKILHSPLLKMIINTK